jgi:hypothetical protein
VSELAVDDAVEQRVLGTDGEGGPALVEPLRVGDRGLGGAIEDLAAAVGGRPLRGGVEDLLEHAWYGEHERRLEPLEIGGQVLDVGAVPELGSRLHAADLDDPREDVGQGEEEQRRGILGLEQLAELVDRDAELEHEVPVRQHAALGLSGGPGRVDEGGQVERRGRRTPLLQLVVGDVLAERGEHVHCVVGDRPDVVELLEPTADLGDPGQVVRSFGDDGTRRGVAQDPLDLLGGRGLVDRNRDRAGEPDRVVEERPLVAGLADQGDPVAGLDTGRDQALRHSGDLGEELGGGDVRPACVRTTRERRLVRGLPGVADDVVGQVARRRDLGRQRRGVLTHRFLLGESRGTARRLPPRGVTSAIR